MQGTRQVTDTNTFACIGVNLWHNIGLIRWKECPFLIMEWIPVITKRPPDQSGRRTSLLMATEQMPDRFTTKSSCGLTRRAAHARFHPEIEKTGPVVAHARWRQSGRSALIYSWRQQA